MNSFKQAQKCRVRRLPHVSRETKFHVFYPTYRGALSWMRQHKDTLDTVIRLLEIYPSLIKDYSLNLFWDFIQPFLDRDQNIPQSHENKSKPSKQSVVLPKIKAGIPKISVTHVPDPDDNSDIMVDTSSNDLNKIPKVYIDGKLHTSVNGDTTFAFVETVSSFAYVCHKAETDKLGEALREADYLVFLLSDQALTNMECCQKLVTAWSLSIHIIFVRDSKFMLPSPLPETFLQLVMQYDGLLNISNIGIRRSLTPSERTLVFDNGKTSLRRTGSVKSMLEPGTPNAHKPSFNSSNMVLGLINGYRDAIVIDDMFPMSAIQELKTSLNRRVDMSRSCSSLTNFEDDSICLQRLASPGGPNYQSSSTKTEPFLSTSTPLGSTLQIDTAVRTNRLSPVHIRVPSSTSFVHLEIPHSNGIDQDPDSGVHSPTEQETFYIVYPDPMSCPENNVPKVVKWPLEAEFLEPNLSPESTLDSPITFNDIDLSTEVNYDLFSSDGSINLDY